MDETHNHDEKTDRSTAKHASRRLANSAGTLDSKELGDLGELAFVLAASSKGLAVSKPFGDCRRYDLIVDSGRRLLRIQVKSVYRRSREGPYKVNCSRRIGTNRLSYTIAEIDYLAAYLAPDDLWYLVPISAILIRRTISLYPDGPRRPRTGLAGYEQYKEAWAQLDERTNQSQANGNVETKPCHSEP